MIEFDRRRDIDRKAITERDKTSLGANESWYILSAKWLQRWHHFMGGANVLPGPITNKEDLLDANNKPKPHLVRASHYRGVSTGVYKYFEQVYGGGPPIKRQTVDIYDKAGVESAEKDQLSNNHT